MLCIKMRFFCCFTVFAFLQIVAVCSIGQFYVGLLGYKINNINTLCCANISCETTSDCSLLFEIEVDGLNSSVGPVMRRPTETALTPAQAEAFQGDSMTNPVSFQFNKWPGGADVRVHVLDGNTEAVLDQFNFSVRLFDQSNFYLQKDLTNETSNTSSLTIVFRYVCGQRKSPPCFTDCADHDMNETCPVTPPTATQIPPDVITFTGFTDRKCETTDADGKILHLNCSTGSPATPSTAENETVVTPPSTSRTSSNSPQINSTSFSVSTTGRPRSISQDNNMNSTKPSTKIMSKKTSSFMTGLTSNPHDPRSEEVTNPTTTPPNQGISTIDNSPTAIWPGIVGGVLGGVALIAASAFICYWNRQKKLQKRQEIYNVNPKILRNFEEFEENGTSGRADVPMETEQY